MSIMYWDIYRQRLLIPPYRGLNFGCHWVSFLLQFLNLSPLIINLSGSHKDSWNVVGNVVFVANQMLKWTIIPSNVQSYA